MLSSFYVIAFTHKNLDVNEVGKLHIADDKQKTSLFNTKEKCKLSEFMFLSTCNRVEFIFCTNELVDNLFINSFFDTLYPELAAEDLKTFTENGLVFHALPAVEHLLEVASSIDSMIVGEREIITQVRNSYDNSKKFGLTGDFIRLVIKQTVETAKKVYTQTSIANKPVSVVALAYHKLRDLKIDLNARIVIVGAGVTNTNMGRFLKKHGYSNFTVFNRTISKAESLAKELGGTALPLSDLMHFQKGFDIIISCTGSEFHIISPEIYESLLNNEQDKKVVIDIAIPQDLDKEIINKHDLTHISVAYLQTISDANLNERTKEITHVKEIISESLIEFKEMIRIRKLEIAMREVPNMMKNIKSHAVNTLFKADIDNLNSDSKEVLEKIIAYMEKKYISVPMKMAKEIILKQEI